MIQIVRMAMTSGAQKISEYEWEPEKNGQEIKDWDFCDEISDEDQAKQLYCTISREKTDLKLELDGA